MKRVVYAICYSVCYLMNGKNYIQHFEKIFPVLINAEDFALEKSSDMLSSC